MEGLGGSRTQPLLSTGWRGDSRQAGGLGTSSEPLPWKRKLAPVTSPPSRGFPAAEGEAGAGRPEGLSQGQSGSPVAQAWESPSRHSRRLPQGPASVGPTTLGCTGEKLGMAKVVCQTQAPPDTPPAGIRSENQRR